MLKTISVSERVQEVTFSEVDISLLPARIRAFVSIQPCQRKGLKGDCWSWTGFRYQGYGRLRWAPFKTNKAHRIVYQLFKGLIPDGLETDHLCLNRSCVNPDHIEPVTRAENIRRSHTTGNGNGTRTHCRRGHELTDENTYAWRGKRFCRDCGSLRQKAWVRKKAIAAGRVPGKPGRPARIQPEAFAALFPAGRGGAQ